MDLEKDDSLALSKEEIAILRETFFVQAMEMTESLSEQILALDKDRVNVDSIKKIKRYFHTLKGDSSTIGLKDTAAMIHRIEDLMERVEERESDVDDDLLDIILKAIDEIAASVKAFQGGSDHKIPEELIDGINRLLGESEPDTGLFLTEYEELKATSLVEEGRRLYSVRIYFAPDCVLKSAGAMVLAQHLPKGGDIIKTEPELDSSEIESAEHIHVVVAASIPSDELERIYTVAEVTGEVCIKEIDPDDINVKATGPAVPGVQANGDDSLQTLRIKSGKIDQIMDLVGELVMGRLMMGQLISRFEESHPKDELVSSFLTANSFIGRSLADLQRNVMSVRMVSIDRVFKKLPRVVRDLCRSSDKDVDLVLEGETTEVDKALVDVLGEPLLHIIRNAVDHGVEPHEERKKAGKNPTATIKVSAFHKDNDIIIKIKDDGCGIDISMLKMKAVDSGVLSAEEADMMEDNDAVGLIFLPGLTTAEEVSDVSGRGIGMDIVKEVVENMRGVVGVRSNPGHGTEFTMRFPMTLAILRTIIFESGTKMYAMPMSSVVEIMRAFPSDIDLAGGREMLRNRDKVIPLVRLSEIVGGSCGPLAKNGKMFVLILCHGEQELGLVVDRLIREEELVVKAVDEDWIDTNMVSGASILGDGKVVMILNAAAVMGHASGNNAGVYLKNVAN